jgi:hypothetical protein
MDLKQRKLNKSEWDSTEISVSDNELSVLNLIISGYHDVRTKINKNNSIFTFLKIEFSEKMEDHIYNRFLRKRSDQIEKLLIDLDPTYKKMKIDVNIKPNSSDRIRLERFDEETIKNNDIYEFILMLHLDKLLTARKLIDKKMSDLETNIKLFHFHYYTLYKLIRNNIIKLN